jgi:hypothetical protein
MERRKTVVALLGLSAIALAFAVGAGGGGDDRRNAPPTLRPPQGTNLAAVAQPATPTRAATQSPAVPSATPRPSPSPATFIADDGSFQVTLASRWSRDHGVDPFTMYVEHPGEEVLIRHGRPDEGLRTCDRPAGPWETCVLVRPTSLQQLTDAIGLAPIRERPCPSAPTITKTSQVLDGEPAVVLHVRACEVASPRRGGPTRRVPTSGTESVTYIVAMSGDTPFLIRVWSSKESGVLSVGAVLSGFAFRH